MKKILLFILLVTPPLWALDTNEDLHIKETGQMFIVRVIPGKKQTEFFITGKKVLNVDLSNLRVQGNYLSGSDKKFFKLTNDKDRFVTNEDITGKSIQLEIKTPAEKVDVINIDLKRK